MTDRVEQGQPELLGALLIALHLQHGESAPLTPTVSPDAQQLRLPLPAGAVMIVTFCVAGQRQDHSG